MAGIQLKITRCAKKREQMPMGGGVEGGQLKWTQVMESADKNTTPPTTYTLAGNNH